MSTPGPLTERVRIIGQCNGRRLVGNYCTDRLEIYKEGNSTVTGNILKWNIADLSDAPFWQMVKMNAPIFATSLHFMKPPFIAWSLGCILSLEKASVLKINRRRDVV